MAPGNLKNTTSSVLLDTQLLAIGSMQSEERNLYVVGRTVVRSLVAALLVNDVKY
jgi:hypothetical protein